MLQGVYLRRRRYKPTRQDSSLTNRTIEHSVYAASDMCQCIIVELGQVRENRGNISVPLL